MDNQTPDKTTTKELLYYSDPRPVGKILVEKHRMPGYQVLEPFFQTKKKKTTEAFCLLIHLT